MKKQLFLFRKKRNKVCNLIGCFTVATLLLGAGFVSSNANAAQQVGVAAAVRGNVSLTPENGVARPAIGGGDVNFQETVKSGLNAGLQVMLLDETVLTIGADAELVIDEMVYDPAGESHLALSIARGAFRYVSGEIASQNPENVKITTPLGTIGIRGTNLVAIKTNDGWFFGLFGPGAKNNAGNKVGGFVFNSPQGSTEVRRAGYGFFIKPGEAPGAIIRIPAKIVSLFQASTTLGAGVKRRGNIKALGNIKAAESKSGQLGAVSIRESIFFLTTEDADNALDEQIEQVAQELIEDKAAEAEGNPRGGGGL